MKTWIGFLVILAIYSVVDELLATTPDFSQSFATMNDVAFASIFITPSGGGNPIAEAYDSNGNVVDATITVTLLDAFGDPVVHYPAEDIWLDSSGTTSFCPAGSIADEKTNFIGETTFSASLKGGGSCIPFNDGMYILVAGEPLPIAPLPLYINSPDINGDLLINMTDYSQFSTWYNGIYNYKGDFAYDGVVNMADLTIFATYLGITCTE